MVTLILLAARWATGFSGDLQHNYMSYIRYWFLWCLYDSAGNKHASTSTSTTTTTTTTTATSTTTTATATTTASITATTITTTTTTTTNTTTTTTTTTAYNKPFDCIHDYIFYVPHDWWIGKSASQDLYNFMKTNINPASQALYPP